MVFMLVSYFVFFGVLIVALSLLSESSLDRVSGESVIAFDRPGEEKKKRREAKAADNSGEMSWLSDSYDDVAEEEKVVAVDEEGKSTTRWW